MNQFNIKVTDKSGNVIKPVGLWFINADGTPLMNDGKPYVYVAEQGTNTMTGEQPTLKLKVTAPGYADKNVELTPGENTVTLDKVQSAAAKSGKTWLVVLIVVAVIVYLYMKYANKA